MGIYYTSAKEITIQSECFDNLIFSIHDGTIKMFNDDIQGDTSFPCVTLKMIPQLIEELEGIYEVYYKECRLMKYLETKDKTP